LRRPAAFGSSAGLQRLSTLLTGQSLARLISRRSTDLGRLLDHASSQPMQLRARPLVRSGPAWLVDGLLSTAPPCQRPALPVLSTALVSLLVASWLSLFFTAGTTAFLSSSVASFGPI